MSDVPDIKVPAIKNAIICQTQATILSYVNFSNSLAIDLILSNIISSNPFSRMLLESLSNHF